MIDVDGAGDPLLHDQRYAEDGEDVLGDDRFGLHEALIGARVGGHDRLSALDDFLHDRLRRALGVPLPFLDVAHHPRAQ